MTIDSNLSVQALIRRLADKRSHSLDPYRDAQRLLEHILGQSRAWLLAHSDYVLQTDELKSLEAIHDSFSRGTPLAYLCGKQEFWSLPLAMESRADFAHLVWGIVGRLRSVGRRAWVLASHGLLGLIFGIVFLSMVGTRCFVPRGILERTSPAQLWCCVVVGTTTGSASSGFDFLRFAAAFAFQ